MTSRSILFCAAAILFTGCVATPAGQVAGPGKACPMNFMPYCEVSGHRTTAPNLQHCRCVRHSEISGMLGADY